MDQLIRWKNLNSSTYLYGSELEWLEEGVLFRHSRLPAGTRLHLWSSRTIYQKERQEPQLPLLQVGSTYQLSLSARVNPAGTLYVQISFYDRAERKLDDLVMKEEKLSFIYPKGAYYYQISLINAGCVEVMFESLRLRSLSPSQQAKTYFYKQSRFLAEELDLIYPLYKERREEI